MSSLRDALLLFGYCGLIFWLSDQPSLPVPPLFPQQDKFGHIAIYALMGWFSWRMLSHWPLKRSSIALASLIFCSLYGLSDEWHQSFVPGRDADIWDWLADFSGAVMALATLIFLNKRKAGQEIS
ncbi:MAG: VanZ family protein [Mariprofundaceae bacterium]